MTEHVPSETCTARLVIRGPGVSRVVDVGRGTLVLGRDVGGTGESALVLAGEGVSPVHCRLEPIQGGGHRLVDMGSTGGTWANERRITAIDLVPFDRLRIGKLLLVYLDTHTDAQKVLEFMSGLEDTSILPLMGRTPTLRDELLSLILGIPELSSQGELQSILGTLLDELQRLIRCQRLLLVLFDPVTGTLRLVHGRVASGELPAGDIAVQCLSLVERALRGGEGICHGATALSPDGSTTCVPLRHLVWTGRRDRRQAAAEVRGALLLAADPYTIELSAEEERLLIAFARQLAVLISTARLHRQATIDPLTGAMTRGSAEKVLEEELHRAQWEGECLGLILLDVDDFKLINDTYGHGVGDEVLSAIGDRLRQAVRREDVVGRWGGEEFLVILPDTEARGAGVAAEKIVQQIAAAAYGEPGLPVTVSAGVAVFPVHGCQSTDLLRNADQALYAAKRAGKNRVVVFSEELEQEEDEQVSLPPEPDEIEPERSLPPPIAWIQSDLFPAVALRPGVMITFGRSRACDIFLGHAMVSRRHAIVRVDDEGAVLLEDVSTNGTYLNDAVVVGSAPLTAGDWIRIGPYRFEVREQTEADEDETHAFGVLAGTLQRTNTGRVLRRLASLRSTGRLTVQTPRDSGFIDFDQGQPLRATLGALRGEEAIRAILRLREGTFSLTRSAVVGTREIEPTLEEMLGGIES